MIHKIILKEYLVFLIAEFKAPATYINAFIVGVLINLLTGTGLPGSVFPYLVPVFIQALSKSTVRFKNRYKERMVQLPAEREDPVFIMSENGDVILSIGITDQTFHYFQIKNVKDFIGTDGFDHIMENKKSDIPCEVYSEPINLWYEVKLKPLVTDLPENTSEYLVWFQDISSRKEYDERLSNMLNFSSEVISDMQSLVKNNDIYDRLARFFLDSGFRGVFITQTDAKGNLNGLVFKIENKSMHKSDCIKISKESSAPVLFSRKEAHVVSDDMQNYSGIDVFESKYSFNEEVKSLLSFRITNFINYHEDTISIIAFNKKGGISKYDREFMEVLVNNARTIFSLVDLAVSNDEQFIQKVMGLCAASEYSDEITGKHILRVNEYSRILAEKHGLDEEFVETIGQVAALHDIGKVAIPNLIKLERIYTPEERLSMQMHTVFGIQIINTMKKYSTKKDHKLEMAGNIALHHHQFCNGSGYPRLKSKDEIIVPDSKNYNDYTGLKPLAGEEIPVEALIVGLADVYDALRNSRQYKPAFSHEKAIELLDLDDRTGLSGEARFGSSIWNTFRKIDKEFDIIYNNMRD